jgi:hypothetical protein
MDHCSPRDSIITYVRTGYLRKTCASPYPIGSYLSKTLASLYPIGCTGILEKLVLWSGMRYMPSVDTKHIQTVKYLFLTLLMLYIYILSTISKVDKTNCKLNKKSKLGITEVFPLSFLYFSL